MPWKNVTFFNSNQVKKKFFCWILTSLFFSPKKKRSFPKDKMYLFVFFFCIPSLLQIRFNLRLFSKCNLLYILLNRRKEAFLVPAETIIFQMLLFSAWFLPVSDHLFFLQKILLLLIFFFCLKFFRFWYSFFLLRVSVSDLLFSAWILSVSYLFLLEILPVSDLLFQVVFFLFLILFFALIISSLFASFCLCYSFSAWFFLYLIFFFFSTLFLPVSDHLFFLQNSVFLFLLEFFFRLWSLFLIEIFLFLIFFICLKLFLLLISFFLKSSCFWCSFSAWNFDLSVSDFLQLNVTSR